MPKATKPKQKKRQLKKRVDFDPLLIVLVYRAIQGKYSVTLPILSELETRLQYPDFRKALQKHPGFYAVEEGLQNLARTLHSVK